MSSGGGPDAFTFVIVAYDLPERIESICPYKDRVYVGLADGSLVVLEPEFEWHEDGPWSVERHIKGVGKKAITHIEPAPSLSALFVLSSTGLQLLKLPELETVPEVSVPGIPFRFAWNDAKGLLCAAIRKTLVFYKLEGMSLLETTTVTIPDALRFMAWCGDRICYASRTRYVFVDPSTEQLMESITVGRGYPVMTPLANEEILLIKDNCGMYARSDGKLARNVNITWSQAPLAVVLCEPFVVGLLDNFMEVRNISPTARQCVIQMFNDVDRINVASLFVGKDGSIFMASRERCTVCRLNPVPLRQQIDTLIRMKEFQDALQVVDLLDAEDRTAKEDDIRVSYGIDMFKNKEYSEGLMQFMMRSRRTPLLLLKSEEVLHDEMFLLKGCGECRLFPSLLPKEMLEDFPSPVPEEYFEDYMEPEGEDYCLAVSCLLPLLLADRTRLASRKRDDMEEDKQEEATLEAIEESQELPDGVDTMEQGPSKEVMQRRSLRMQSRAKRMKLAVLVDTAIMKAMLVCPDSGALLQFVRNENSIDLVEGERSLKPAGRYFELSALYQSHGLHDVGLEILRLVSLEPEKLDYPPRGAASDLRGVTGVWAAVQYLSKLTVEDSNVIQKHSSWVLRRDPEAALEVFVGAANPLPPSVVLPILREHAPQYRVVYLEAMLEKGMVSREEYDMPLVQIYLEEALVNEKEQGALHNLAAEVERYDFASVNEKSTKRLLQKDAVFDGSGELLFDDVAKAQEQPEFCASFDPPTPLESYTRLRELLIESPFVNPTAVLDYIPQDRLLELRALLMERKQSYRSALAVYIQRLHDLTLAEKLCDRVWDRQRSSEAVQVDESFDVSEHSDNVYMDMIRIYLEPEKTTAHSIRMLSDEEWKELCALLCRKRYRINIEEMFQLLPEDVDLGVLMPFIEGALRTLAELQRNLLIKHSLYMSENFHQKEQLIHCNQRSVHISYESACCLCHKRIGNAVFVAYPDGSLAHLACYNHQNKADTGSLPARTPNRYHVRWE